jgi:hypothetical protein
VPSIQQKHLVPEMQHNKSKANKYKSMYLSIQDGDNAWLNNVCISTHDVPTLLTCYWSSNASHYSPLQAHSCSSSSQATGYSLAQLT